MKAMRMDAQESKRLVLEKYPNARESYGIWYEVRDVDSIISRWIGNSWIDAATRLSPQPETVQGEKCACGVEIEHVRLNYWKRKGTGEVCKDNHWHRPVTELAHLGDGTICDEGLMRPFAAQPSQQENAPQPRKKAVYVGAPAIFALEMACQHIVDALGGYGCYLVGSALERPDWRDIDVRFILSDDEFASLFPHAVDRCWEQDSRWLLMTVSISAWLSKVSGLPVDFQIQPQTHANEQHKGPRNAMGLRIRREEPSHD